MKLAILLHGGVDRSGAERVIPCMLWMIERLSRHHDVHVFALNQEPEPASWDLLGARVHNVGPARGWRRRLLATFGAEHRNARFDLIHGIFGWGGTYGALLGACFRLPVLFHPAGGELSSLPRIGYGNLSTARGRLSTRIALLGANKVTVSTHYMQQLAARLRVNAEVVPLGVALDCWPTKPPRPRDPLRSARLLHVGDLRTVKDQPTLFAAVHRLHADGRDVDLDVAGLDTTNGEMLSSRVVQDLGSKVHFHGQLGRDALRRLVERADLLLMTSLHDAAPLAVLECAVAGVPSVGTAVGYIADFAPDAAVAVPVGDDEALARETAALLDDEPRRLTIAHEAQRRAVAMDADVTARTFERIYAELAAR